MLGQGQEVASADEVASLLLQAMDVGRDGRVGLDEFMIWFRDPSRVAGRVADVGADVARAELWRWSYLRVRPRRACNALARSARLGPVV
jgi:hypothetical protein